MMRWKVTLLLILAVPLLTAAGTTASIGPTPAVQTPGAPPATTAAGKKNAPTATQPAKQPPATQPAATATTTGPAALLRPTPRKTTTTTVKPAAAPAADPSAAPAVDTSLLTRDAPAADALPRKDWKTWDDGVAERAKSGRFRLAAGVRSGSLSLADARVLMDQERAVAQLSDDLKGDDKLDDAERAALRGLLEKANALMYTERNAAGRLNGALLKRLEAGELTVPEAKELCAEVKRVFVLHRALSSNQPISPAQRSELGVEYDQLATILHE
jgi:hypothetical protein